MSPKRIFSSIFQLSTFFSTHLALKAFLITWGRLHEWMVEWLRIHPSFRSSVVRSSKVVTVLIHSVQHFHQQLKNSHLFWWWLTSNPVDRVPVGACQYNLLWMTWNFRQCLDSSCIPLKVFHGNSGAFSACAGHFFSTFVKDYSNNKNIRFST